VTIIVANAGCLERTFAARDLPRDIPDNDPIGITSSLSVAGNADVASLALSLRIAHPFPPELAVALISPAGTQLPISELPEDPDAGGVVIANQLISAFNGQSAAGVWTLAVQDLAVTDAGRLDAWSLTITTNCSPIRGK
jgi:subtilisin-like proprotein convertase family protein